MVEGIWNGGFQVSKPLSEMTLQELWQLFPIQLSEHKEYWQNWYQEEKEFLASFFPQDVQIYHIGSTAINGIWAKPIVDILVEARPIEHQTIYELLLRNNYLCMAQSKERMDFNKGYTEHGFAERVFHLHLRNFGDHDELYFRDYLNDHHDVAKEYENLKLSLWKQYEYNRDGYTQMKTNFVRKYTQMAKEELLEMFVVE